MALKSFGDWYDPPLLYLGYERSSGGNRPLSLWKFGLDRGRGEPCSDLDKNSSFRVSRIGSSLGGESWSALFSGRLSTDRGAKCEGP